MPKQNHKEHLAVLTSEVVDCLNPRAGESYLDLTAGYGGHAEIVLARTGSPGNSLLVDRDDQAIKVLAGKFAGVPIEHTDFLSALGRLAEQAKRFNLILADLGVSSPHFNIPSRGFAFSNDGPLDMRMDQRQELTAEKLVNTASEAELDKLIGSFGEERAHRLIAKAIVAARPLHSTRQLAEVVAAATGRFRNRRIHPATKTFQAIRIAVNDELGQLEQSIGLMCEVLAPGGRLAIISFHSLEDRIVKNYFKDIAGDRYDAEFRLLTKKPVLPSPAELAINPRARSARLRAVAKIKT